MLRIKYVLEAQQQEQENPDTQKYYLPMRIGEFVNDQVDNSMHFQRSECDSPWYRYKSRVVPEHVYRSFHVSCF